MRISHPRRQELSAQLSATVGLGLLTIAYAAVYATAASGLPVPLIAIPGAAGVFALVRVRAARKCAARARVGRQSEQIVARRLGELANEGWTTYHSVRWRGRGDIDHVTISPAGTIFVIETKTRHYEPGHLDRTRAAARAVGRRRAHATVVPVLCMTRGRAVRTVQRDVLVVSEDVLVAALRDGDTDIRERGD